MQFKGISANIESRVVSPTLWQNIRKNKPDYVVVQQAYRARQFLKRIKGYKVYHRHDAGGGEFNGVAVLVRNDVEVVSVKWLVMDLPWIGGKAGKRHEPRVYPALRLRKDDADLYVVGVHLPTYNAKAPQAESFRKIADYFNDHKNSAVVAVGDWNNEAHNLRGMEKAVNGQYHSTGKVDGMLSTRCKHLNGRRVPFPRYAHGWGIHTVNVEPENRRPNR